MRRVHLFEFHDLDWFPHTLGDAGTAFVSWISRAFGAEMVIAPLVQAALDESSADRIVDLCSGGGGPCMEVRRALGVDVPFVLTDLQPNLPAFRALAGDGVTHEEAAVCASQVPDHLKGLRTIFNAFHHFRPELAKRVLRDAARAGQPIFIAELSERTPQKLIAALFIPLAYLISLPFLRPFRLSWLLHAPIAALTVGWDGLVSQLRAYSVSELREMTSDIEGMRWTMGRQKHGPTYITWLMGVPVRAPE